MNDSPYISFMLDESTDRSLHKHLVVYATFLDSQGLGLPVSPFMKLISVGDGKGRTIYDALQVLRNEQKILNKKLIAIFTDGASSMVGNENGFVAFLKKDVPNLIVVHYVAHCEALVASDASKIIPELVFVEKVANKVYSWVQNSTKRTKELIALQEVMKIETLHCLQIHGVRWLSRGQVIERLVALMPAILTLWKSEKKESWYDKARIFSVQFCLHILADVLCELNKLNKEFQVEHIDVTSLGATIDATINTLRRMFLNNISFPNGACYLSKNLEASQYGYLQITDKEGVVHKHEFLYTSIPHAHGDTLDTQKQRFSPYIDGTLQSCIQLTKDYVQRVIDCLNARFPDLSIFNAVKLFSPSHYSHDILVRENNSICWIEILFEHLQHVVCNEGMNMPSFDINACKKELHQFIDTLHSGCEGFSVKEAWRVFCISKSWQTNFPNMLKLWQETLVILASTVACERGFSKQNLIKDIRRSKLVIGTLDVLMRLSLNGPDPSMIDWEKVYDIWRGEKQRGSQKDFYKHG